MPRKVVGATLDVYDPDASIDGSPRESIPQTDIESMNVEFRAQNSKDSAEFVIDNDYGDYTGVVTPGDKLVFSSPTTEAPGVGGVFGTGPYDPGGDKWVGVARNLDYETHGAATGSLSISASDFVFTVLSWRLVYDSFENRQVAGTSSSIVDILLGQHTPEIDASGVETVSQTEDLFVNGRNMLDVMIQLAKRADAVLTSSGETLIFRPRTSTSALFEVTPHDYGTQTLTVNDDSLVNDLRVDGGIDHDIDSERTTRWNDIAVTENNRHTVQVQTRKSEIDRLEIYTYGTHEPGNDKLRVRLQKDDGGSPVAIDDSQSDIVSKSLSSEFLADDGWTTFLLPEHTLPEPNPWLICETNGTDGQVIGMDGSSPALPAYKAHYKFPISVKLEERASIEEHMRREGKIKNDNLSTFAAARATGNAKLTTDALPRYEVDITAESPRMRAVGPGDIVTLDMRLTPASGDYIVASRTDSVPQGDTTNMTTEITLKEASTV